MGAAREPGDGGRPRHRGAVLRQVDRRKADSTSTDASGEPLPGLRRQRPIPGVAGHARPAEEDPQEGDVGRHLLDPGRGAPGAQALLPTARPRHTPRVCPAGPQAGCAGACLARTGSGAPAPAGVSLRSVPATRGAAAMSMLEMRLRCRPAGI